MGDFLGDDGYKPTLEGLLSAMGISDIVWGPDMEYQVVQVKPTKSLIFGASGQDGSYLSEYLTSLGNDVMGVVRRCSTDNKQRIRHISDLKIVEGDITDAASVANIISDFQPNEIYNLAAQSHVHTSFNEPSTTFSINTIGVINILEAIRKHCHTARFVQASTSEMFGNNFELVEGKKVQNVHTKLDPVSPYAVSKVAAHHLVNIYRDAYNLHLSSVIMMNHESPRRGVNFVTRKITKWIGENLSDIRDGKTVEPLHLGNINSCRDWSHAKDFVRGLHLVLQQDKPKNLMLASNESHSVRDFLDKAFSHVGLDWTKYVKIDPQYFRPVELDYLCGDSQEARQELGWLPEYNFDMLVADMVESDIKFNANKY